MNRIMLLILFLPVQVFASHGWSSFDICEAYKDKLPPGLTIESLADSKSPGAVLLNQYCTQCHNLPGPDRHTAAEWREVTSKMFMLMDVSHRFGGLAERVEIMQKPEQETLLAYLEQYASGTAGSEESTQGNPWLTRILVLGPFLLLMGAGLVRWRHRNHGKNRPCV